MATKKTPSKKKTAKKDTRSAAVFPIVDGEEGETIPEETAAEALAVYARLYPGDARFEREAILARGGFGKAELDWLFAQE